MTGAASQGWQPGFLAIRQTQASVLGQLTVLTAPHWRDALDPELGLLAEELRMPTQ